MFVGSLALVLALALAACQAPPPPRPAATDPAILAAEALGRAEYAKAADLYRRALAAEPESVPLHYGLGVSASYLDRRPEAVSEFKWVLERGDAESTEVKAARRWLLSVGALPRGTSALPSSAPEEAQPEDQKPAAGSLQGRVMLGDTPNDLAPMERMQLFLYDYPNRVVYFRIRTDEQGRFRFPSVPPGVYKLTDRAAGQPRWRLRVELKAGQDMTLNLDPGNSTKVRDDFPAGPRG